MRIGGRAPPEGGDEGQGARTADYKLPLLPMPQPEGGYTITSPTLLELVTEGDTVAEALENAENAFAAVVELHEDMGRTLPQSLRLPAAGEPFGVEIVIAAS